MTKIFFTSDTHFDHANIIHHCNRPFKDVYHMNEELITRWNSKVMPNDQVYHCGDFSLSKNPKRWEELTRRLNGQIFLIKGNHDHPKVLKKVEHCFSWIKDYHELMIPDETSKNRKRKVVLCHYAMRVWNKQHYGSFHLYGHSHGTLDDNPNAKSMDVGVDCHNYTPISYEKVRDILLKKDSQKKNK